MNNFKLAFFILFLVLLSAFIQQQKGQLFALFAEGSGNFTTQIQGDAFPKTLVDRTGIEFQLSKPPTRIVSATLASDHMLSDLINPQRLLAVSSYVDYPSLSNIVGFYDKKIARTEGEIESILALQPDLVFIASFSNPETVRYLLRSQIPVVRLSEFNSFADIFSNIRIIAAITNTQARAEVLIDNIQERIAFIQAQLKHKAKPRVLYYDLNGYSVGGNSLMDEAIRLSGGINVAAGVLADGENKISEELAISLQPDVIVMNQWVFNQRDDQLSPTTILANKKAWANVPAIKNKRLYAVPGVWLRSVSQHRIKGVEAIAQLLHPDIRLYQERRHVH